MRDERGLDGRREDVREGGKVERSERRERNGETK